MGERVLTEPQALIIELLAERGRVERAELLDLDELSTQALAQALSELVSAQLVAPDPSGAADAYVLTAAGKRTAGLLDHKRPYHSLANEEDGEEE